MEYPSGRRTIFWSLLVGAVALGGCVLRQPAVSPPVSPPPPPSPTSAAGVVTATVYALEKDGSHIFDGAVIAAINEESGKMVAEGVADRDGKLMFAIPPGHTYRFQPSPLRENRVAGSLLRYIPSPEFVLELRLTEIGPLGFGAPVRTCEAKREAIELAFATANYCTADADCRDIPLGGKAVQFGCWKYVHRAYDIAMLSQRLAEYTNDSTCNQLIDECAPVPQARCVRGRCVAAPAP